MASVEQYMQAASVGELRGLWSLLFLGMASVLPAFGEAKRRRIIVDCHGDHMTKLPQTNVRIAVKLEALCGVP